MSKNSLTSKNATFTAEPLIICVTLAFALGLRLWGVGYGLPFVFHPDENRQILDAMGMAQRLSVIPEEFSYPALHKYLLLAASGAYYLAGRLFGLFTDPADFALKFLEGEAHVFLLGRLLSVAAGVAVCASVYKAGREIFSRQAGLFALIFAAGMFHLVQHSQWAIADIFLSLLTIAALYFIILSAYEKNGAKNINLALLFTGLAISTKPQGVFLILPLFISQYFAFMEREDGVLDFARRRAAGILIFIAAALIGNLAWVFEFGAALEKFRMLSQVAKLGISSKEPFEAGLLPMSVWFFGELIRQEGPLGAALVFGIIYSVVKRKREDIIFISYLALFMFAVKDWAIRYLHLFVAIFPALCLFGARAVCESFEKINIRKTVALAFAFSLIIFPVAGSVEASIKKTSIDTRLLAKAWVEQNIPEGNAIALDWYEFTVPLWSATPVYLHNPKASSYYEKKSPAKIREGYREYLKSKRQYQTIQVIYSTDEPNWPVGMDGKAREAASGQEVYRELYSVFNFRTLDELRGLGASYLIISSYGYTNFLLDGDPEKNEKAIFNYLFKEDLLSFNRQSDTYIDDGRFGLLFDLNKRAREFYRPLLENRAAKLIKEFSPADGQTGPVIKIYRL